MEAADDVGGQGQNRTAATRIFSPLLYRLSYLADLNADVKKQARTTSGDIRLAALHGLSAPRI